MSHINIVYIDINNICFLSLFNAFSKFKNNKNNTYLLSLNENSNLLLDNAFESLLNNIFDNLFNNIHNLQLYKSIIPNITDDDHFIFFYVKDCSYKDNWRQKIFNEYKLNRKMKKREFDYNAVFCYLYDKISNMVRKKENILCDQNLEADDIIYYSITTLKNNKDIKNQIIISNDSDYFQVHDNNIYQIDAYGKLLTIEDYFYKIVEKSQKNKELFEKYKKDICNNRFFKLFKILLGDKGDNIPPVISDQKIGKIKLFNLLLTEQKKLQNMIASNPIYHSNFKLNTKLIDLSRIPINHIDKINYTINTILNEFKNNITNNNQTDFLNNFKKSIL